MGRPGPFGKTEAADATFWAGRIREENPSLSDAQVCELLGCVEPQELGRWRRGERGATVDRLRRIVQAARAKGLLPGRLVPGLVHDVEARLAPASPSAARAAGAAQAQRLEEAHAAAVAALRAYAGALAGARDLVVLAPGQDQDEGALEVTPGALEDLARGLERQAVMDLGPWR